MEFKDMLEAIYQEMMSIESQDLSPEEAVRMKVASKAEEVLKSKLSEEQQKELLKLSDILSDYHWESARSEYKRGFQHGLKFGMGVLGQVG